VNIPNQLIKEICLRLLIRGNREWDGKESRRVVAASHALLKTHTNKADFRKLVIAVFRVGRVMDFSYEKQTYKPPDWESFRARIKKLMGDSRDSDRVDFFIERLQGVAASHSIESRVVTDWVEVINRIQNKHNINVFNFDLDKKLKIAETIEALIEERIELKAICAATDMGISIEDLSTSLVACFRDVNSVAIERTSRHCGRVDISPQEARQKVLSLCDPRAVDQISTELEKYPHDLSKVIARRWSSFQEDVIAESLWSKGIRGTSGSVREMVICKMGTHYRLLYRSDTNLKYPFLAFGLRRDLVSMVETAKSLVC